MTADPYAPPPTTGPAADLGRRPLPTRAWARRPHVASSPPVHRPGRAPRQLHQGVAITCRPAAAHLPAPVCGAHVVVNGHELLQRQWGRIELPLPAGHHQVLIYLPRGRRRSRVAQCAILVPEHHLVELEYSLATGWFGGAGLAQPPDS